MLSLYVTAFLAGLLHATVVGLVIPSLREENEELADGDEAEPRGRKQLAVGSPVVVAAFLCGAGGSGSLVTLTRDLPELVTLGTACLAGALVAALLVTLTRGLFPPSGLHDADVDL